MRKLGGKVIKILIGIAIGVVISYVAYKIIMFIVYLRDGGLG